MKKEVLHERMEFPKVRDLVEWAGDEYAERTAYSFREKPVSGDVIRITFSRFRDDVRALATEMLARGCDGKHCVVIGKFSYDWALTYFAGLSIGAVIVPLDGDWLAQDLADTASTANADFVFCDKDLAEKAAAIAGSVDLDCPPVYMQNREEDDTLYAWVEAGRVKYAENSESYNNAPIDAEAMSLLVFTSGTTGKGKGVMLSQHAVLCDVADVIPYVDFSEKTVGVLPLHHTFGSSVMLLGHISIGCEVYISAGLRYVQKELKEQKPGHMILVPLYLETFYRKILANVKEQGKEKILERMIKVSNTMRKSGIDVRKKLFASIRSAFGGDLRMIISGGAPINPEIVKFFEAIGISTLNGYGITECAPVIAVNHSRRNIPGTVGAVIDSDTVRIDAPNEDGEGEICVKGPNVMLGYYRDPEATAEAIGGDGFFRTGDYGKLDENNILTITGRKKNLIILSNGKNVYPEEIENMLIATPGVQDIIVYEGQSKRGIAHNAIVAEIYPDKDYMEKNGIEDMKEHFRKYVEEYNRNTAPYKKISVIKVRKTEFPKNTLRKIMRFKLDTTIE